MALRTNIRKKNNINIMKKIYIPLALTLIAGMFGGTMLSACGDDKKDSKAPATKTSTAAKTSNLPNYRYVDLDTVLAKYNLAKDYNDEMMRVQSSMESTLSKHESRLQNMAASMQQKMNNNGYLTRESYEADQRSLAGAQNEAQRQAATLQKSYQEQAFQAQKTINDSIQAFITEYNKAHGYDAILFKAATLYINPDLDITNEVVEGLNARYNKIKK